MIERLRALAPPLRYLIYVAAGVLLVLSVAVGMGATAAVVVDWQSGPAATSTSEGSKLETTSAARASEGTAIDSKHPDDTVKVSFPDDTVKVSFIHRATDENSRGDYTYISDLSINGDPNAIVLVSHQKNPGAASYPHHIGVWYEPGAQKWAIFNQDRAAVSAGATFEVEIPQASAAFVHRVDPFNTAGNYTYLDNRLTNGKPDAVLSVTQNWNPGGGSGVYNDHPVGVIYDSKVDEWAIYNLDGAPLPQGAAFNVAVSEGAN
jgi:hypothetical protein